MGMKVTFVYPRFEKFLSDNADLDRGVVDYFLGDFTTPPSLGIPLLAALTPPDIEVELIDDNSGDPIDVEADTDLVAINCFTPQATRAYEIADAYRRHGKRVIMGGIFPSFMVDECLQHADAVNVGEGEPTWPRILADARAGALRRKYVGGCRLDLATVPVPKRDIFYEKDFYDWDEDLVQVTRGCSYTCAMCSIPALMGSRIRLRPVEHVVAEIRGLKHENVYLADDTLFFPQRRLVEYARTLLDALAPLGKKYFVSSTMALNVDKAFLDTVARAGVKNFYCTLNVDPYSIKALQGGRRERQMLIDLVKALEDRDIRFFGSCALGRDWDDEGIADRILDLFAAANIHTAEFFVFTPYPGSVHWDRLERQGRIVDRNWAHYNGAHVVFQPLAMSVEALQSQFIKVWNEFFRAQKSVHAASLEPATWQDGERVLGKPLQRQGIRGQAAVTGIGILSPIGHDAAAITAALREGQHGLRPITRFDTSHFRTSLGGELDGFEACDELTDAERAEYEDRYLHYAITAARRAIADAALPWETGTVKRDVALVLGTCNGGLLSAEAQYAWKHGKAERPFDEKMNLQAQLYGFGKALAAALGVGGETWVVTTACSSTTGALGLAQRLVCRGYYDTVLVGGADALCLANMAGFDGLKATSTGQTAPFSLPSGLNVGEGACFWVVEEMEKAMLRHARCLGRLAGHVTGSDAYHPTTPDPRGQGVSRLLAAVLADAGLALSDIGCVNAHGTGTEANDRAETRGIARVFGETAVPVVSMKSFFGHCMGVTGLLEATCNLYAMLDGFIPPTVNFTTPRPGCSLDYVPNTARPADYGAFVSANYAFGGNNAAVAIAAWDGPVPERPRIRERVVLTGLGTVTSVGLGIDPTLQALRDGTVGLRSVVALDLPAVRSKLAGLVPDFEAAEIDRRLDLSEMNKISRFATAASRLALDDAHLRVGPGNAETVGIAMGVCNGPSEMAHMDSVFTSERFAADIGSFSMITANSTAGWVSNALCLKGVNTSLSPGPHAGLQALAYAYDTVVEGRSAVMLAAGADEVYSQTYFNYDLIGFLYQGGAEEDYRVRLDELKRKVLGEGAATLVLESWTHAQQRGAPVLGEVLGYGMSMDAGPFSEQNLEPDGLQHAVKLALDRAGVAGADIGLVVWAPQGNAQDQKVLDVVQNVLHERAATVPMVTTTFHTGYIEAASILVSLAAALRSLKHGIELWPQRTGLPELDDRMLAEPPVFVLALGSSDVGYNFAVVVRNGFEP